VAFPGDSLGSRVELLLGGQWQDVTGEVLAGTQITHARGLMDRASSADPASCAITLRNTDGQFTPRNPMGPWFGQLGRNTPLRLTIPGGESYLDLPGTPGTATAPDVAALDITGAVDMRWEGETDWYAIGPQMLIGKWGDASQRSYALRLDSGALYVMASANGVTTTYYVTPLPQLPRRAALRGTIVITGGVSACRMYWAPTLDGPWVQFGSAEGLALASLYNSTAPLRIAPQDLGFSPPRLPVVGRCYRAEIRNGVGGTVVASPDFRGLAAGVTGFTDSAGRVWTVAGGAITDRYTRMVGEVPAWPPRWEPSGKHATTSITAAGVLRRLAKGDRALPSTMRRDLSVRPGIVAYWPMEDGEGARQYASGLPGGTPMRTTRVGMRPGAYDGYAASGPLPTLGGGSAAGTVPAYSSNEHAIRAVVIFPGQAPAAEVVLYTVTCSATGWRWQVRQTTTGFLRIVATRVSGDDDVTPVDFTQAKVVTGLRTVVGLDLTEAGTTVTWRLYLMDIDDPGAPAMVVWENSSTTSASPLGHVSRVEVGSAADAGETAIGHVTVASAVSAYTGTTYALIGWAGETATDRMVRVASDAGIPLRVSEVSDQPPEAVGAQTVATGLGLIQEAAAADGGILGEAPDLLSLEYRARATLYNQTPALVLDYGQHLAPPFEPTEDDATTNDVTVTRTRGSSARAVLETGGPLSVDAVGRYEDPVTLNLADDDQAEAMAWWRLHIGTWDEARYPSVTVRLHRHPELIPAVLGMRDGDRIRVTGLPLWVAPGAVDLLAVGMSEVIEDYRWEVTWTCVPAGPYEVGVLDDPARAKVDTDGSELTSAATASATTLTVATTAGPVWVRATAPLTDDTGWTAGGGTWSWDGPERGGRQTIAMVTDGATTGPRLRSGAAAVTAGIAYRAGAWVQATTTPAYGVWVRWLNSSGGTISDTAPVTTTATGVWTWVDTGSVTAPVGAVSAQVIVGWPSASFPAGGTVLAVDQARLRPYTAGDMPQEFPFDVTVGGEVCTVTGITGASSPQTFTVVRAVNGISKAHSSGEAVSLAQPMIIAL
jgi:hypothetical protein